MTYDADGLRSTKQINGVKTEYQYVGDKLFYEKRGDGNSFYYFYDSYGKLSAIYHHVNGNKTAYHVVTNAQGDVIALYSWTGTKVAEYSYDAWGNCTIVSDTSGTGIASLNPFRYRSYYRDTDLGLYYLQSRYYDSEIGRFINADGYITTGQGVMSYNMFAYCLNNPVNMSDPTGQFSIVSLLVVVACVFALSGCSKQSSKPPSSTLQSTTSTPQDLTQEQKHFVSVIAGEAIGANSKTQKAVAHTIMNRLNEPRDVWSNASTVSDILVKNQYNAVESNQYNQCMTYLNNRDGTNQSYEDLINAVIPIYDGLESDFTGGAHYIFNVNGSAGLLSSLQSQPERYIQCPSVDGVDDKEYCMYRCLW